MRTRGQHGRLEYDKRDKESEVAPKQSRDLRLDSKRLEFPSGGGAIRWISMSA